MPSLYALSKRMFRATVPYQAQRWMWGKSNPLSGVLVRWKLALEKRAAHDEIYDAAYYAKVDAGMKASCDAIATSIVESFHPATVVDVGCGTGALLSALRERGVSGVGFDQSVAALELCRSRGLDVQQFDLESGQGLSLQADVAISLEVAEHLPEHFADSYVDLMTSIGPVLVMTAATPDQRGTDHVNEQPHAYWIEKIARRGYSLDEPLTEAWRREWQSKQIESCYASNVMVFRKG